MINERKFRKHVKHAVRAYKTTLDMNCCNCNSNQRLNIDSASKLCGQYGLSRNVLQQGFKNEYGMGIRAYKLKQRMAQACQLLEAGRTVNQVAFMLHYTKERTFQLAFKKYYGTTPAAFVALLSDQRSLPLTKPTPLS